MCTVEKGGFGAYYIGPMKAAVDIMRKYSLREVTLLLVFALGLLIAVAIVVRRNRIQMSDVIEFPHSGLSVSIPTGRGWISSESWTRRPGNEFELTARLTIGTELAAVVHCRYLMAPEKMEPGGLLEKNIALAGMEITRSGQMFVGDIAVEWAQLIQPMRPADIFLGIAQLPTGKVVVIDVHAPNDRIFATRLFQATARSIVFNEDELAAKGTSFVSNLKATGIGAILRKYPALAEETAYMAKDAAGRASGFNIGKMTVNTDRSDWADLKIESTQYAVGAKGGFVSAVFECSDKLDRFLWYTEQSRMRSSVGSVEMELSQDGRMRVSSRPGGSDASFWPGPGAIPHIYLDAVIARFLDSYQDRAVIDIILSSGLILPALVSTVDVSQDKDNVWGASYAVRVQILGDASTFVQTYFDFDKKPVGIVEVERDSGTLFWHKVDRETVIDQFGNLERYLGTRPHSP